LLAQSLFQAVEELTFKGTAELMDRVKVFPGMPDVSPLSIKCITGSGVLCHPRPGEG